MNLKLSSVPREKLQTSIHTSMRSSTSSWEIFSLVCARSSVLLQLHRGQHYNQRVGPLLALSESSGSEGELLSEEENGGSSVYPLACGLLCTHFSFGIFCILLFMSFKAKVKLIRSIREI